MGAQLDSGLRRNDEVFICFNLSNARVEEVFVADPAGGFIQSATQVRR
jgi:hypothetical protein